jgi:hypothetical protein
METGGETSEDKIVILEVGKKVIGSQKDDQNPTLDGKFDMNIFDINSWTLPINVLSQRLD